MPNQSQSKTGKNARRHRRAAARGVTVRLTSGDVNVLVTIGNVSVGGLFAPTSKALDVGAPVALELSAPSLRAPLRLKGRVANTVTIHEGMKTGRLEGLGIEFVDAAEFDIRKLESLIAQLGKVSEPDQDAPRPARGTRTGCAAREDFAGDVDAAKAEVKERRAGLSVVGPVASRDPEPAPARAITLGPGTNAAPGVAASPPAAGSLPQIRKTRPTEARVAPPVLRPQK